MIIDAHAHLVTPASVFGLRAILQVSGGRHSKQWYRNRWLNMEEMEKSADRCVALMDQVGTDMQLLSPRPFMLMHSHKRFEDVDIWIQLNNDLIHHAVQRHPTRFRGVAGLPQVSGQPIEIVFPEIDRCINELGFVGVLVNPDPDEGGGASPRLGDPYWYPLWEKCVAMDLPVHIHSAGCCGRETYDEHFASEESLAVTSVIHSEVFQRFPGLKMMISHGGGSIPFQIGRWRAAWLVEQGHQKPHIAKYFKELEAAGFAGTELPKPPEDLTYFDDQLRKLWFDTDVHAEEALELLFKVAKPDRCLFGTERPGSGYAIDPATGRSMEDFKYVIDRMGMLSDQDRQAIYEDNARTLFSRLNTGG